MSRQFPIQACLVDQSTHQVNATISAPELLSWPSAKKEHKAVRQFHSQAHLIERLQHLRIRWKKMSQKAQSKGKILQSRKLENLGVYTDRLIAKRLVAWAMRHEVSVIVLPSSTGIKDRIESDLQAKAVQKFPHYKKLQKRYAKAIRARYPHWSYSRLIDCISACSERYGISVLLANELGESELITHSFKRA